MYLTKEALEQANKKLKIVKVMINDEDYVFIKEFNGKTRDELTLSTMKQIQKGKEFVIQSNYALFGAKLCALCLCDEAGNLLYTMEDYKHLAEVLPSSWVELISKEASILNGLSEREKAEEVKNSQTKVDEEPVGVSAFDSVEN